MQKPIFACRGIGGLQVKRILRVWSVTAGLWPRWRATVGTDEPFAGAAAGASLPAPVFAGVLGLLLLPMSGGAGGATNDTAATKPAKVRQWSAALRWENDTFGGTDRFYTDGVSLSLTHTGPSWMDPVADRLPWGEGRRTVGYDLSQIMITPEDTKRVIPDPADRPYAGILALGLTLHVERSNAYHGLKFLTGVVGPWSLAEETQREVHRLIGSGRPKGWSYQLENEPIVNFAYEYRHRFQLAGHPRAWAVEALPVAGGWLGNFLIQGQFGGLLRAGYNIPKDFGPTLVRGLGHLPPPNREHNSGRGSDWGFSVHGGSMANLVVRDITLDGNTFEDSPRVDKNFFVPMAGIGLSVGNRRFQASFTYVFWGKEFEGQRDYSKFGAATLSYYF